VPLGAADPAESAHYPGCAEPPAQALPARRRQCDAHSRDRKAHNFDAARQTGTLDNSPGYTGFAAGSVNREAQAKDPQIHSAASARHQKAIPNQHASFEECDTIHMYVASKTVWKNREKTPILKGEMSFATETSYENVNDAERLRHDPAMRWIVAGKARPRAARLRQAR
jgi:hypothetical protein